MRGRCNVCQRHDSRLRRVGGWGGGGMMKWRESASNAKQVDWTDSERKGSREFHCKVVGVRAGKTICSSRLRDVLLLLFLGWLEI